MREFIEFPQRQHQEFKRSVFKSVFDAAHIKGVNIEAYISAVFCAGENPELFSSLPSMQKLYLRFKDLIDSTVSSDPDVNNLSDYNKAYLCFRVYLHNMCMERQTMPESDTEQYLQDALKEYFRAGAKVLSSIGELKIMRYLKRHRLQALSQLG
jgi:hypothetical protein